MMLTLLRGVYAVVQLDPHDTIPSWVSGEEFCSVTRTAEELSIVVSQTTLPANLQASRDWRALKVDGPLEHTLIGVLNSLTQPLAAAAISIFALSTFDTDYILVKDTNLKQALIALSAAGHTVSD